MAPSSDSEVRVQKVDKIELVYNLLTRPVMYSKPMAATMKQPAADHGAAGKKGGNTASRGIVSTEDINKRSEIYIRERKKQFLGQK